MSNSVNVESIGAADAHHHRLLGTDKTFFRIAYTYQRAHTHIHKDTALDISCPLKWRFMFEWTHPNQSSGCENPHETTRNEYWLIKQPAWWGSLRSQAVLFFFLLGYYCLFIFQGFSFHLRVRLFLIFSIGFYIVAQTISIKYNVSFSANTPYSYWLKLLYNFTCMCLVWSSQFVVWSQRKSVRLYARVCANVCMCVG